MKVIQWRSSIDYYYNLEIKMPKTMCFFLSIGAWNLFYWIVNEFKFDFKLINRKFLGHLSKIIFLKSDPFLLGMEYIFIYEQSVQ